MDMFAYVNAPVVVQPRERFLQVAVGGGLVGAARPVNGAAYQVRCPECAEAYPMAADPMAFGLGPEGATVLAGYSETCPLCLAASGPGTVLEVAL